MYSLSVYYVPSLLRGTMEKMMNKFRFQTEELSVYWGETSMKTGNFTIIRLKKDFYSSGKSTNYT